MSVSGESSSDGRRRLSAGLNVPRDTRMLPLMDTVNDFKAEEKKNKKKINRKKIFMESWQSYFLLDETFVKVRGIDKTIMRAERFPSFLLPVRRFC